MLRKYLPFILLIAAALLFYWVKTHQRGGQKTTRTTTESVTPALTSEDRSEEPFDRDAALSYSKHARCRMDCRHVDEDEIREVIREGAINFAKIEETKKGRTYPLEGITRDRQRVRVVVAPHEDQLTVVTVIDLDKEWQCDCN